MNRLHVILVDYMPHIFAITHLRNIIDSYYFEYYLTL